MPTSPLFYYNSPKSTTGLHSVFQTNELLPILGLGQWPFPLSKYWFLTSFLSLFLLTVLISVQVPTPCPNYSINCLFSLLDNCHSQKLSCCYIYRLVYFCLPQTVGFMRVRTFSGLVTVVSFFVCFCFYLFV